MDRRLRQIQDLIDQQYVVAGVIARALENLTKVGRDSITNHRIQVRLAAVREQWERFSRNHDAINNLITDLDTDHRSNVQDNHYFTDNNYATTLEGYLETVEHMNILLEERTPTRQALVPISESQIVTSNHGPRLPRCDLPKFNGDPSNWLSFKDMFTSLILHNNSVSPVGKLQYLKASLIGSAAHLLKNTATTADNFQGAWEALISFYENKRLLVNAAVHSILSVKRLSKESAQELEHLYGSVMQAYRTLETLQRPVNSCHDFLIHIVSAKLDAESIKEWEHHLGSSKEPPIWQQFSDFLMTRLLTLKAFEKSKKTIASSSEFNRCHFTAEETADKPSTNVCPCYSASHQLFKCQQFACKTFDQKKDFVVKHKLCYNCLGRHQVKHCQTTKRCSKCVQSKSGEYVTVRALLDQGAQSSLVSESLAQHLRLKRQSCHIPIIGIGGHRSNQTKGLVTLRVKPHSSSQEECTFNAFVLPKLTSIIPSRVLKSSWAHLEHLQLADPQYYVPGPIDILLGADVHAEIIEANIIKGPKGTPIAQLTKFGWVVSGSSLQMSQEEEKHTYHLQLDYELYNLLEKFWKQEELLPKSSNSATPEDLECEQHFSTTHSRDSSGRYIVRLPLKRPLSDLGDSEKTASRILMGLVKKFTSNPTYYKLYSDFLQEYLNFGHMRLVPSSQEAPEHSFYLPHHGVIRESSLTTKLRVVFNGSKTTTTGVSLNNILHSGPKLQNDLFNVIIWFRQFKYVFTADMEKMFRQIQVHPSDWDLQRILWVDSSGNIQKYQLTTVTYGLACAPFLAIRTVLQLIQDEGQKYPLAVPVLEKGRYVDDIFGGSDSITQTQEIVNQVNELCMAGGFQLHKWISNHPETLLNISKSRLGVDSIRKLEDQTMMHALGLSWNPQSDTIHFSEQPIQKSIKITKRTVLSAIAQMFDPLGLISPVTIKAKILMQQLWLLKLNWDDPLPSTIEKKWIDFYNQLSDLSLLNIPRWLGMTSTTTLEIHGFSDASQEAIAAVVYIRATDQSTFHVTTTIVASKTKVAPLKRLTIPRLELLAATLLVKLTAHVIEILNLQHIPIFLWTDSTIVHTWLSSHPSKWKEYVHNRVCYIQETLPLAQWRFVPGECNPADCASRGMTPKQLSEHTLWWKGPDWLKQSNSHWPTSPTLSPQPANLEEKPVHACVAVQKEKSWDLLNRFSSFRKLLRVTALCRKFGLKWRKIPSSNYVEAKEIAWAKTFWLRYVQQDTFHHEIELIKQNKSLPKTSPLYRLMPILDQQQLLRVRGRLQCSPLAYSAKHPVILPRHSHLSKLLIADSHSRTLHGGTQVTLMDLRNEYWILGGRAPVRSFILKCVRCARFRQERARQLMGQLPSARTTPSRPFLHSGVDYAGPLLVKSWKGRGSRTYKAYFVLFVCFSTSAVHIELVTDYTAEGFIAAYKRFTSRRGICSTLTSDCGTPLIGADNELRRLFTEGSEEAGKLATLLANDGTKWQFNPPGAPHFGGKWEAGVKSVKFHLKRVLGDHLLTYEELTTLLNQIEAVLNSRPLCPLTEDAEDLQALTPGHFLTGGPISSIPEPSLLITKVSRLSRWQLTRQMLEEFWKLWSKSCLQRYLSLSKWTEQSNTIKKGTLVLICDERYPPSKWPLARIVELHPGPDGLTRVVTVKTATSTFKRPIVKLCPLPTEPDTL